MLPLNEQAYRDREERFELGTIAGYKIGSVNGYPLVESPDGNLAYTVVVQEKPTAEPFDRAQLAAIAVDMFENGEGFKLGVLLDSAPEELLANWTGQLTFNNQTQPMRGFIFARQNSQAVFVALISATEGGMPDLDSVLATVIQTLKPL
jgi:hypothetical protein